MDFGRALFGPIGGVLFAFMVAFSCFGALNGIDTLDQLNCCLQPGFRVFLHVFPACLCCQSGALSPGNIRQTPPLTKNTFECNSAAVSYHDHFHYVGQRFSVVDQFLRRCIMGILLLDCEAMVCNCYIMLMPYQVLGLVILRIKEPLLER